MKVLTNNGRWMTKYGVLAKRTFNDTILDTQTFTPADWQENYPARRLPEGDYKLSVTSGSASYALDGGGWSNPYATPGNPVYFSLTNSNSVLTFAGGDHNADMIITQLNSAYIYNDIIRDTQTFIPADWQENYPAGTLPAGTYELSVTSGSASYALDGGGWSNPYATPDAAVYFLLTDSNSVLTFAGGDHNANMVLTQINIMESRPLPILPIQFDQGWTNEMYDNYGASSTTTNTTKLLLHGDGPDASTTFTDNSDSNHQFSTSNDPEIDTSQYKFGGSSMHFDGNDYITCPASSDFDFGSGDFTIDFWIRFAAIGARQDIFGCRAGGAYWMCAMFDTNTFFIDFYNGGTSTNQIGINPSFSPSTWYHIALVKNGANQYCFVNGQSQVLTSDINGTITATGDAFKLGTVDDFFFLNGHVDEFRIVKGEALYTSNFDVPTSAYPNPSALKAAWTFDKNLLTDDSGNEHTLTNNNGVTLGSGKSNNGASLQKSNSQYLTATSSDFIFGTGDFTYSAWINYNLFGDQYHVNFDIDTYVNGILMRIEDDNDNLYIVGTSYDWNPKTYLTAGEWGHVVLTRINGEVDVYVNGVSVLSFTNTASIGNNGNLTLGKSGHAAEYFNGGMDEVLILKGTGLSQTEVQELYKNGEGRFYRKKFEVTPEPFNPLDLNPEMWLKSSAITGLSDGDAITTWDDSSEYSRDATQSNGGNKPVYKTNIFNSYPSVRFNGSSSYLESIFSLSQPSTIFIVATQLSANEIYFDGYDGARQNAYNANTNHLRIYSGAELNTGKTFIGTNVYSFVFDGSDSYIYVNGVEEANGNAGTSSVNGFTIGARYNQLGASFFNGDMAEMIVYSGVLSDTNRGLVETYLNNKYNI